MGSGRLSISMSDSRAWGTLSRRCLPNREKPPGILQGISFAWPFHDPRTFNGNISHKETFLTIPTRVSRAKKLLHRSLNVTFQPGQAVQRRQWQRLYGNCQPLVEICMKGWEHAGLPATNCCLSRAAESLTEGKPRHTSNFTGHTSNFFIHLSNVHRNPDCGTTPLVYVWQTFGPASALD